MKAITVPIELMHVSRNISEGELMGGAEYWERLPDVVSSLHVRIDGIQLLDTFTVHTSEQWAEGVVQHCFPYVTLTGYAWRGECEEHKANGSVLCAYWLVPPLAQAEVLVDD